MKIFEQIEEMQKNGQLTDKQAFKAVIFLEDLIKEGSVATTLGKQFLTGMALGGGMAGVNIAFNKAVEHGESAKLQAGAEQGLERMLAVSPQLRQENQEDVKNNYATLLKFAPSLAMDPYAAAGYISRVLQFDPTAGADYNVLRTVVQLEKDHQDAKTRRTSSITDPVGSASGTVGRNLMPDLPKNFSINE